MARPKKTHEDADGVDNEPIAEKPQKSRKLDFTRPYGTVHGMDGKRYEQDGKLFDVNALEIA